MEIVVELYVCKKCQHVELELNGSCGECGGEMECVDFVPRDRRPTTGAVDLLDSSAKSALVAQPANH